MADTTARLLAGAILLCSVSCTSLDARVSAGYFQSEVRGQFALDTSTASAQLGSIQTDIEDNFGIDEASSSPYVRADLSMPFGRVAISGFRYDESGTGQLPAGATFGDIGLGQTSTTAISTDLTVQNIKVSWTYDLIDLPLLRVSPGLAVDIFDIETEVRSVTPISAFEQVEVFAPVPMIYVQGELDLGYVAANLDIGAMDVDLPDADGTYWDIDAMIRVRPGGPVEFFAGYRFIHIDGDGEAEGQAFDANLQLNGWFLGGGVTF